MPGPSSRKAQTGLKLVRQLADQGLFTDRPAMIGHLANMEKRAAADLAHEFLTDHWQPQHSVEVHRQMGEAGLALLGSAEMFNNLDISLSVPGNLQGLIRQTRVPALAETLKDMARNAHQRMDLFQKAPVGPDHDGVMARFGAIRFHRSPHAPRQGPVRFSTPIGPITGPEAVFTPLLQGLASGSATGAELARLPAFSDDVGGLLQAVQLLMMQEMIFPANPAARPGSDVVRDLSRWFDRNGIALAIVEEGATAVARPEAG